MSDVLIEYIKNHEDSSVNFDLAEWYFHQRQYSSAGSYYLRSAEFSSDATQAYRALLNLFLCLNKLGGRVQSERSVLNSALLVDASRPEAYLYLSKSYEATSEWQEAYLTASLGLQFGTYEGEFFLDYPGKYALLFQKALGAYHLNKSRECRELFRDLVQNYEMAPVYYEKCLYNSRHLGSGPDNVAMSFFSAKTQDLVFPFSGSELVSKNYAQSYQDLMLLALYDGRPGTYLEIGAADPYWGSNTALLEEFGWTGVGIENQRKFKEAFDQSSRKNVMLLTDATKLNYKRLLGERYTSKVINYLQLDCEPPSVTFDILLSLPLDEYKFGVITFEHDYFVDNTGGTFREKSRRYLKAMGYELLINDVGPTDWYSYEDWWVHPEVVDPDRVAMLRHIDFSKVHCAKEIFVRFKD